MTEVEEASSLFSTLWRLRICGNMASRKSLRLEWQVSLYKIARDRLLRMHIPDLLRAALAKHSGDTKVLVSLVSLHTPSRDNVNVILLAMSCLRNEPPQSFPLG